MKVAIFDLGTVSIRFEIYHLSKGEPPERVYSEKIMQRLGQKMYGKNIISADAAERTIKAFSDYREVCEKEEVEQIVAVATSATRDAENRTWFVDRVRDETGILLDVISGEEEARLTAEGIIAFEQELPDSFVTIDIGGGSTEYNLCVSGEIINSDSFDIGALRIHENFLRKSPPEKNDIEEARHFIREKIEPLSEVIKSQKVETVLGSSATIRGLVNIVNGGGVSEFYADTNEVLQLVSKMQGSTREELLQIPGIEENRVDIILGGALIFDESLKLIKAEQVRKTLFSLRHGLLARLSER